MADSKVIVRGVDTNGQPRDVLVSTAGHLVVDDTGTIVLNLPTQEVIDGNTVGIVHDPLLRRLLEEILVELHVANAQRQQLLVGNQTDQRGISALTLAI